MAVEPEQFPIADLIGDGTLIINDGYRAKNSELSNIGPPFARAGNIDGGFHFAKADRVPPETLRKVGAKRSKPGDVVFTSKGTVGRFAFVREETPEFVYSPQLCFWRSCDTSRINPRWLFYWMHGREFHRQFKGVAGQTDMAEYVSLRDQRAMKITLPPLAEQKAVAGVLGALDDKIELNRRMNATLEAMARALFQSWFVDFDPVRAKQERRLPAGLDEPTAALFPDQFQDTEIGEIPSGWRLKRIEDIAERVAMGPFGSSIKVSTFVPDGIPVISGQHLHGTTLDDVDFNFVSLEHADQLHRSNVQREDVIFTHAGNIGQVTVIPESSQFTRYVISQRQFYMRCDARHITPLYITLYFKTPVGQHRLLANTSQTGVPSIAKPVTYLRQLQLIVPPRALLSRFDEIAGGWMRQIAANLQQSRALTNVRDTLLPKLLSGQVRINKEAE
jgi:type I restriction enzyme S subunit